jgi:hypothetical protein
MPELKKHESMESMVEGCYRVKLYKAVDFFKEGYKVLRKDLSSLNFSLGDVAHAALLSNQQ